MIPLNHINADSVYAGLSCLRIQSSANETRSFNTAFEIFTSKYIRKLKKVTWINIFPYMTLFIFDKKDFVTSAFCLQIRQCPES